jgi:hypothetical protein
MWHLSRIRTRGKSMLMLSQMQYCVARTLDEYKRKTKNKSVDIVILPLEKDNLFSWITVAATTTRAISALSRYRWDQISHGDEFSTFISYSSSKEQVENIIRAIVESSATPLWKMSTAT